MDTISTIVYIIIGVSSLWKFINSITEYNVKYQSLLDHANKLEQSINIQNTSKGLKELHFWKATFNDSVSSCDDTLDFRTMCLNFYVFGTERYYSESEYEVKRGIDGVWLVKPTFNTARQIIETIKEQSKDIDPNDTEMLEALDRDIKWHKENNEKWNQFEHSSAIEAAYQKYINNP